ncbi:MAG: glycosyltransferase family 2 protein [Candidatus Krumholzibacteria bacterium]|nr:glycosyltransferase family 2 protein [Candidatus Krumholzibacteria bacterium]MDH4337444.1 glycosyltransferase family 2 protein [Candidatus Krumholzibacteria bacterium]MDH5270176.1 glycosyltransferase family 2 protein [Candidatus Krumholzibacteria bacterium]
MPPETTPAIAVIVLTWNGRDLTLDCLDSLAKVTTPGVSVLVVDNASSDGTVEAVRERFGARVTVLSNPANLGYAAGNNAGIRRALDDGATHIVLLNNDTLVDPAFIAELAGGLDGTPGGGIAGPKIYYSTPPDRIWFAGGEVSMWRGTARHIGIRETDRGQYDTPRPVGYVSGCALMARREVFERVGMLDPSYRAYFEDTDFCVRASRAGFGIRYVPTAKVWHRISASTGGQLSRRKATRKLASARRFFCRYARPWHWLTIPLFFTLDVIRIGVLILAGRIRDGGPPPQSTP